MGFNLAGTELISATGLSVVSGGNTFLRIGTTGAFRRYATGHPMFRAGNSGAATNPAYGTNTWVRILFNAANPNVGTCFNTANGAFTAPVAGMYLFSASTYANGPATGYAIHGMFWVNGSSNARRPTAGSLHRLNGHGVTAGHWMDTESTEIISLLAGDYVQFYNAPSQSDCTLQPQYSHFEGYMLG